MIDKDTQQHNREQLDRCESFGEIFTLVKKTVERTLGQKRSGLLLYLTEMPLSLGAYHGVGSNTIVLNNTLLKLVEKHTASWSEVASFIYSILLHEYLHSLGHLNEQKVRHLCSLIANENFGSSHPATRIAKNPALVVSQLQPLYRSTQPEETKVELIKDFEKPDHQYII